ncbi:hypothetical protein B0T26DRAFT_353030 [Lasiosphaeria miniovina]|uniref:Uncharacterized protein n=1 Tax=Lasiosphaeria miniovina TaxID=1954250 RepID=A0AA40ABX6_9PEZI|nr:uncharacterized protein B0T26DRAFT_353030 [Lasiosphaeria miniovina]KAK0713041.1 hypothetical protein B0T26DRAFT_353030 [Lasiosphaeria miniovina]
MAQLDVTKRRFLDRDRSAPSPHRAKFCPGSRALCGSNQNPTENTSSYHNAPALPNKPHSFPAGFPNPIQCGHGAPLKWQANGTALWALGREQCPLSPRFAIEAGVSPSSRITYLGQPTENPGSWSWSSLDLGKSLQCPSSTFFAGSHRAGPLYFVVFLGLLRSGALASRSTRRLAVAPALAACRDRHPAALYAVPGAYIPLPPNPGT